MLALKFAAKSTRSVRMKNCGLRLFSVVNEEYTLFPREKEGNVYAVNWSLTADNVVPVGDAFRNARLPILTSRLPQKVETGKVELQQPPYTGIYKVSEAGDSISHEEFEEKFGIIKRSLSSGADLFVEDAGLGLLSSVRVGVRIVTDSSAVAMICRNLLVMIPPRPVDHRARFHGWNLDERWAETEILWSGSSYDIRESPSSPVKGQRPVVAFISGNDSTISVQFIERSGAIVGANVIAGVNAPVRGLVDALGHAATVLTNESQKDFLAVPSTTVVQNGEVSLIIGADDSIIEEAISKNILYSAYHNLIGNEGISAVWNGVVRSPEPVRGRRFAPAVVVGGKAAIPIDPDNMVPPASRIVFYSKEASSSTISEADAVKRLLTAAGVESWAAAEGIIKKAKVSVAGSAAEALK